MSDYEEIPLGFTLPDGRPRYCSHCRKTDHDDNECWSTRAVTSHPASSILAFPPVDHGKVLASLKMSQELRDAIDRVCGMPRTPV